jgi:bis(5'-nucleosyl)-tetraphosphatase (symmetrical)
MPRYAIGDLQGHYDGLLRLLERIQFEPKNDELWFVGDLVNRGPQSLEVLRFLSHLSPSPKINLGNHDLYLLQHLYSQRPQGQILQIEPILKAPDRQELGDWLRHQTFLYEDTHANLIMVHAGISPTWTLSQAKQIATELKTVLHTDDLFFEWMNHYFAPRPQKWSDQLQGLARWQTAADYFTRMRFTNFQGELDWSSHQGLNETPANCYPWFACPKRTHWSTNIIFGHWASLLGKTGLKKIQAIDTGFHWGGVLTALNLDHFQRFSTF